MKENTMNIVYKYPLNSPYNTTIEMPRGAKILCIQLQHDVPCLWALVDPKAEEVPRVCSVYGTGHTMVDGPGDYIGTLQFNDGVLVFHFFIERE